MSPRKYQVSTAVRAQRRAAARTSGAARAVGPTKSVRMPVAVALRIERRAEANEPTWRAMQRALDAAGW